MKKIIYVLLAVFLLCGCGPMNNTPTKQVEMLLARYQTLDADVLTDLDKVVAEEENFNTSQRDKYRNLMKKHYQDLTYDVKDERIDGDEATVTVEIEVRDYTKAMRDADSYLASNPDEFKDENDAIDQVKFMDYRLEQLMNVSDKVKYTIDFTLTKRDNEWKLNELSETDREKINGTYLY